MPVDRLTRFRDLPEWMSVEEVMAYLDIGRTTAYDAARSGGWRVLKVGRMIRVHRSTFAEEATGE
jgi:excisionase family DNA binding protein